MSSLYESQPNSVKIAMSDDSGDAERFVVGLSLDEVIAVIEASFGVASVKSEKKPRKKRRTKLEMAATEPYNTPKEAIAAAEIVDKTKRKSRKEKELVGAGTAWPG